MGLARGIFVGLRPRGGYDGDRRGGGGFVNGESGLLNVLRAGCCDPRWGRGGREGLPGVSSLRSLPQTELQSSRTALRSG